MSDGAKMTIPQLRPLNVGQRHWQQWLSITISIALFAMILWKLHDFGLKRAWETLPASPRFWSAFAAYYLALPLSEWLIFRKLWNLPAGGLASLLRKLVSNEVLLGYSGEAYFYTWARRHARLVAAPFGAIKDVSILSALAGNLFTLLMLALAWPLVGEVAPQLHGKAALGSAAVILAGSIVVFVFKSKIFSLPPAQLRAIFGVHMARLTATTLLSGTMWHVALPQVPLIWLVLLATLQLLVTRLPMVPYKDMVFASLAIFFIGHDAEVGALIAMIATAILGVHLLIGGFLVLIELLEARSR